ncbi:hypothetical protein GCM10007921_38240 [Tritonibacter mobilis]|nr:hypothetical protein GCM10007921_38240 [Tritonibacter mobilis]
MRSPDIRKDLDNISKEMSNLQSEPAQELKTMSFMSRLPSVVRLAKRLDNSDIKKISREVQKAYKSLKHESERADAVEKCGQVKDYWNVQQKVRELSEEIKIQNSDMMVK